MQDILRLDSSGRMNTPGTIGKNWQWRFEWTQLFERQISSIKNLIAAANRLPKPALPEDFILEKLNNGA